MEALLVRDCDDEDCLEVFPWESLDPERRLFPLVVAAIE